MMSPLRRWLSTSSATAAQVVTRPRFSPVLLVFEDRLTPSLSFSPQQSFDLKYGGTPNSQPYAVAVGDFNADGRADFVALDVTTYSGSYNGVWVGLSTTAAGDNKPIGFAIPQNLSSTFPVGAGPSDVKVSDVNGDGRPDIVVSNSGPNTVSVLLNTTAAGATTATFAPKQDYAVGLRPNALAVGDVNGDGRPDLVVANFDDGTVSVLLNTTAAGATTTTFQNPVSVAIGAKPYQLSLADVNGDGRLDIVTANQVSNTVSVLLNTASAGATVTSFSAPQAFVVGTMPSAVSISDVNGDGRPDIITSNAGSGNLSVLLNTSVAGAITPSFAAQQNFAPSGGGALTVADLDGDGRPDLVCGGTSNGTVAVLLNTTPAGSTQAAFASSQSFAVGTGVNGGNSAPVGVTIADFNADGHPDIIAANRNDSAVSVLSNNSGGTLTSSPSLVGQFGTTGVWGFNRASNSWTNLSPQNATTLAVAPNGNAVANFGANGVWYYRPLTGWTPINGVAASSAAIDQYGNAYVNFAGYGTYMYRLASGQFVRLGTTGALADKLAVSANGDVIANFNGYGVYRFRWTTDWQQLNGYNATSFTIDPNGFVVASFTGFGVGQYIPYANGWRLIAVATASATAVDGYGHVFAAFTGFGVGQWNSATNMWTSLTPLTSAATSLAADWYGNLAMAVPGFGVSEYSPTFGWFQRRTGDAGLLALGR